MTLRSQLGGFPVVQRLGLIPAQGTNPPKKVNLTTSVNEITLLTEKEVPFQHEQ